VIRFSSASAESERELEEASLDPVAGVACLVIKYKNAGFFPQMLMPNAQHLSVDKVIFLLVICKFVF
jgi:hypothetical protein